MKEKLIKISYRIFSFLADTTGGWRVFVKPKLLLGMLLVGSLGLTSSCSEDPDGTEVCYAPAVTCYLTGPEQAQNPQNPTQE